MCDARPILATVLGILLVPVGVAGGGAPTAADVVDVDRAAAEARRAGLRVLAGERLVLATDRPVRDGDGVEDLPAIFDQAFSGWCAHYRLDPATLADWQAFGCLVVDRERFRAAGLLPDSIPEFPNGFCDRNRFWLMDQSNPAYRRHLLLHEGVHAFTLTVRGLAAPPWYTEGIAEFLATHRLEPGADGRPRVVPAPLPARPADVEQLGRIERIRALRRAAAVPGLADVFTTPPTDHRDISAYAASWAAVALLALHPAHAAAFAACERGPLDAVFTERLAESAGWDAARAARDFDAFTDEVDYGYDVVRSAIDWSPGRSPAGDERLTVAASRGWQNTGLALAAGGTYAITATGTIRLGDLPARETGPATVIESEADGISLRWYRGRPAGRLLAAQWVEKPADGGRPRFVILGDGARPTLTAVTDGPLYLKINESPGDLADNEGTLEAMLTPVAMP
ncbi:MAG: hypothetical protein ACKON7_07845 [Planctomycetaceae bacterium]